MSISYYQRAWLTGLLVLFLGTAFLSGCGDQTNLMPLSGLEYEPSLAPPGVIGSGTSFTGSGSSTIASPTTTVTESTTSSGTFNLTGSVFDSTTASPIQGVVVNFDDVISTISSSGGTASGSGAQVSVSIEKFAITSSSGKYHFSNVVPGYHVLDFYKTDYDSYFLETELSSSGQLLKPLDVFMNRRNYTLKGVVYRKTQDESQLASQPVEGVEITLKEVDSSAATTTTSGDFYFRGLKSGFYTLIAEKPGYFYRLSTTIEIKKGIDPEKIALFLIPNTFQVQGYVLLDPTEDPLKNIRVDLYDQDKKALGWTQTTDEGLFSFQGLQAGIHFLSAQGPGFYTASSVIRVFDDGKISPASPTIFLTKVP